jgi:hypothetical protein
MANEDRFSQPVVTMLAKRAANRCANPDCGAVTSGPTSEPTGVVNVGEAAHIYGANPGSARYDPDMASANRSAISNAIWLCSNCHKMVDDDEVGYPAGLLFEWHKGHEQRTAERIGKAGAEMRQRYEARHLEEFGKLSYLAERLIVDKGDLWEFRLTAEVLRFEMEPILRRWDALKRGMYMKPKQLVSAADFGPWMSTKCDEAQDICRAFDELMNVEFERTWGAPGVAGSDVDIVFACRLFAEMCGSALRWEEEVRFIRADEAFDEVLKLNLGTVGMLIDEAAKVPKFLGDSFGGDAQPGQYRLELVLTLPDNWVGDLSAALAVARERLLNAES